MARKHFVATLIAIILHLGMTAQSAAAKPHEFMSEDEQRAYVRERIIERFPRDYPVMLAIAYCETRSRPFIHWETDGSLRPHDQGASSAAGTFQVLLELHGPAIREMGLNMKNLDDYLTFVERLMRESPNFGAWNASRDCWAPKIASNS